MGRPLRVGVQLPEVERVVGWPEHAALATAAEEAGFDSVWLGDHMLYRDDGAPERGPWDAWTMLAALAAVTSRVRLGPLVACTAFHPPGVLARMAAAVNEVSDGRLVLGLGTGWNEAEFRAFGIPFDNRVSRFAEAFEIIRRLLAGDRVTYSGRFHEVEDAVLLPPPSRRPALMIGTAGPRIFGLTFPHVDAWNCWYSWYGNSPDGFEALNGTITAVAEEVGRDPTDVERSACVLVGFGEARERSPEEGVSPVKPERIVEHLTSLAAAGADEAILVLDPINEESIRALGAMLTALDGG
jgi:probable F420-dependent oxidoreductase